VQPEAVKPSRIEHETIWLAALCLNQLPHRVLQLNAISDQDHKTVHRLKENNTHHGGHVHIIIGDSQLNCVGMLPCVQVRVLRGKNVHIWNKCVNRINKTKFLVGRTRPLNFTFKPRFLKLYCAMDHSDSLAKPTDISETRTIYHQFKFTEKSLLHTTSRILISLFWTIIILDIEIYRI